MPETNEQRSRRRDAAGKRTVEAAAARRRSGALPWLAVVAAGFACPSPPRPRTPPRETGYVEWIATRAWSFGDLPAVAASRDGLCRRAREGDSRSEALAAITGLSLWVLRETILPALRPLAGGEDLPAGQALTGDCAFVPPAELAAAVTEYRQGTDRAHAVERLVTLEYGGRGSGAADDARLARVGLALERLGAETPAGATPALTDTLAALDPDGTYLPAEGTTAQTDDWDRLVAQALRDAPGSDAVDPGSLGIEARNLLARQGLIGIIRRVLLPVREDPTSTLRDIARDVVDRLSVAWGVGRSAADAEP